MIRPLDLVSPWSHLAIVKLVGSGVTANFPRSKGIGDRFSDGMHLLIIRRAFLVELVLSSGGNCRSLDLEGLLLGSGLLIAGSAALLEECFIAF
jgi:hypothetical protein